MTSSTTLIGDRRQQALERAAAVRRHPARRPVSKPSTPPTIQFYVIALIVAVFVMYGLVMVLSASSVDQFQQGYSPWRIFGKQTMWAALGAVGLWIGLRVPYHFWRRLVLPILLLCFALMLAPLVPGIGEEVNGATAWVVVGPFSFQPSELLKLGVILYCADLLARRSSEMADLRRTLAPMVYVMMAACGLCLFQADLGSAIVIAAVVLVIAFIAGSPLTPLTGLGAIGAAGAYAFAMSTPYRRERFTAFLDITAHKDHLSYQTYQAMIAISNGGVSGEGVGRGMTKMGDYLPLAHSDFIFAVIVEELGLVGGLAVVGGFAVLAYTGVQVALHTEDRFGALLAGGIVAWLTVQTIINIGGVSGLMPVTGLTLPFFSAGGSSLLVSMVGAGLLLNVARNVR
jgi:cell division protein FtsW